MDRSGLLGLLAGASFLGGWALATRHDVILGVAVAVALGVVAVLAWRDS